MISIRTDSADEKQTVVGIRSSTERREGKGMYEYEYVGAMMANSRHDGQ